MKVVLVAMPWPKFDSPSPALGALTAFLHNELSDFSFASRNEFVDVWQMLRDDYEAVSQVGLCGELVYTSHLFPRHRNQAKETFKGRFLGLQKQIYKNPNQALRPTDTADLFERCVQATGVHLSRLADDLVTNGCDVLGLTTSFSQVFSSLALAAAVKKRQKGTTVVLGGMGCRGSPTSLLTVFDCVDFVVEGEGELRFAALLRGLRKGETTFERRTGIISRESVAAPTLKNQLAFDVTDLDVLPAPDYDDYKKRAEAARVFWSIPMEGSRGCPRNVAETHTRRPSPTCYFCGLTTSRPRQKSTEKILEDVRELTTRYRNPRVEFVDAILPSRFVRALGKTSRRQTSVCDFFAEVRATISTQDLFHLRIAGCRAVQVGIEGLSSTYLERINKGTRVIDNLRVMRACFELGIGCSSNLLIGFPGATQEEVDETTECVRRYAMAFQPLLISRFVLEPTSPVGRQPESFGVSNVRTMHDLQKVLPKTVCEKVALPWLDYETTEPPADWSPVETACVAWRELHDRLRARHWPSNATKPLYYLDTGTILEIVDQRDSLRSITLDGAERDLYLHCADVQPVADVTKKFPSIRGRPTEDFIGALADEDLMYIEEGHCLSLAVAARIEMAVARIFDDADHSEPKNHCVRPCPEPQPLTDCTQPRRG